ncbi:sugar ABC transporter substrate-binding protein [Streptomyces sp. NPDC050625]|uniref:ABC transporter substrate-binding protein n=1 Tax=Streptomyces sp. NPDC050625 TaxID=3154629 RepID=UPI00343A27E0
MLQHGKEAEPAVPTVQAAVRTDRLAQFASRRRFLTGLAGAGAAFASPALLTGCGTASAKGATMKFWNFYAPQNSPDPAIRAQAKWFTDLIDLWNSSHSPKIELVYIPVGDYTNGAKLPTAFATGAGPDIFLLSPGDFLRYYNGGVLADLTPHLDHGVVKDYGTALTSRMVDGKVYALPMEVEPLAMFYSIDTWEKAGLSEGDIPTTWDQMLGLGDKLRTRTRAGVAFECLPGYFQNFTWYPWMWQGGGDVVDKQGNIVFDSKATRQALQMWQDAVKHGIAPRTNPAAGDVIGGFKGGNVAMWQTGIWNVASFKAFAPKYRYGVFKLPAPSGGKYVTTLGGWSFCANAQGSNSEAAAEFCAWAIGSMKDDAIDRMVDWCIRAKSDVAPRTTALERGAAKGGYDSTIMKKFKDEVFPGGRAEPRYPPVVYKAISDAIQATMLTGADVAAETQRAAESMKAYTKSYQGASLV